MVETITPIVHGGKRNRYWWSVGLHTIGAALSAALFGAALGLTGRLLGLSWRAGGLAFVVVVSAIYAARELAGLPLPLFNLRRQVPEWWRSFFSPPVAALYYGVGLGIGFLSYLSHGTLVAVAAASLASGDPLTGVALCAPFGLARGLTVAVTRHTADLEEVHDLAERLSAGVGASFARFANGVVLVALAGAAAAAL